MMKIITALFLIESLVWLLWTIFTFLVLEGISEPVSWAKVFIIYGYQIFGAGILFVGSILLLKRTGNKKGAVFITLGCVFLSIYLFTEIIGDLSPSSNNAISGPNYVLDCALMALMSISDFGAFKIIQSSGN